MELVATVKTDLLPMYKQVFQAYHSPIMFLALVGAWYIFCKGLSVIQECYKLLHVIFNLLRKNNPVKKYGDWAVVTGATDGIGKAYAEELANHGMNIILISRNPEKLQAVSEAIAKTYGVKTRFIVADFNKGREVYPAIKDGLKHVDVGILVNNAGVFQDYLQNITEVSEEKIWEIINVNIAAASIMVRIVLPGMVQRKKGAIINISSVTSCLLCPQMVLYGASKAFLDYFSQALHYEYASKGIFIQSLIPFFVITNITTPFSSFILRKSLLVPSAKDYVRQAVRTIGVSRRTTGCWTHSIQLQFAACLPEWAWISVERLICRILHRAHLSNR
ncbi:inactive hydroxysteroid dehydrogenase-like protein 1 [Pelodytes ibericus]